MRILVVTGASGGHIFPALAFLDSLRAKYQNIEALLVLPRISIGKYIGLSRYRVKYISISAVKLRIDFKNITGILRLLKGSLESILMLVSFRPDVVVGFGSLASIAIVMSAWALRIKTLIHEQNVIPGRANRFLCLFADNIAISFRKTQDYFKTGKSKIVFTGIPLRKELTKIDKSRALEFFGFSPDKFTLLVMGGSQASHRINLGLLKAVAGMSDRSRLQIIHLAGLKDQELLRKGYGDLNVANRLFTFFESMQYAYSACDLVISRAGATTIAELIYFKIPAIIIPYPYAYRHQMANAEILANAGSAIIIPDRELGTDILKEAIGDFLNHPDKINPMRSGYDSFPTLDTNRLLMGAALNL